MKQDKQELRQAPRTPNLACLLCGSAAEIRVSPEKQRGTLSPMGLSLGLSPLQCQGTSHSFVLKGVLGTCSAQALCWGLELQQGAIDNTPPLTMVTFQWKKTDKRYKQVR